MAAAGPSSSAAVLFASLGLSAAWLLWSRRRLRKILGKARRPDDVQVFAIRHLKDMFPDVVSQPSPLTLRDWPPTKNFVGPNQTVVVPPTVYDTLSTVEPERKMQFLMAGPTEQIYWDPREVRAAIVTCGGLCPGLNTVVREIVMCLFYIYGVRNIFGVRSGYRGFYDADLVPLSPASVSHVHTEGGTFLGSSRGGFDLDKILDSLTKHGINHVYVIGGDGTHRGASVLLKGALERKMKLAVVGVPKTIDNDVPLIDQSFGFATAVQEAVHPIHCAHTEAHGAINGIGLVRLMGRNSGFIAITASLASRDVNVCLIPEAPFRCAKLCEYLLQRLSSSGHAVIVVAEGVQLCDEDLETLGIDVTGLYAKDESGNVKLPDPGILLQHYIEDYFGKMGVKVHIKYIDPTYTIRSVAANSSDSLLCADLAFNAVHGAFAGRTGFTVGQVSNKAVLIPIEAVADLPPRKVDTSSKLYSQMVLGTGQPRF